MRLSEALKTGALGNAPFRAQQLHVVTPDGLGTVESVRFTERGYTMATLRHFDGSLFEQEYAAGVCELLARREAK